MSTDTRRDDWARTHCEHGTFIGDPFGPDYLCGYCEDGISMEDFQAMKRRETSARLVEAARASEGVAFRQVVDCMLPAMQYMPRVANEIVNRWWDDLDRLAAECAIFDRLSAAHAEQYPPKPLPVFRPIPVLHGQARTDEKRRLGL